MNFLNVTFSSQTSLILIQWHFEQDNHAVMLAALTFALHLSVPRQLVHTLQARRIPWQVSGVSNKPSKGEPDGS